MHPILSTAVRTAAVAAAFASVIVLLARSENGVTAGRGTYVGTEFPNVALHTIDGRERNVIDTADQRPAVIVIMDSNDCLGCLDVAMELRILQRRFPRLRTRFIGSGGRDSDLIRYFRDRRIQDQALLDPGQRVLSALGGRAPIVLLIDEQGFIVFSDTRPQAGFSQYPVSQAIIRLFDTLNNASTDRP